MAQTRGLFTHLINIVFQTQGVQKAAADINAVDKSLIKWDINKHEQNLAGFGTAFNNVGKTVQDTTGVIDTGATKSQGVMTQYIKALKRVAVVVPVWMAARFVMQAFFSLISSQTKFLLDLEDAMARIRIVGKGTEEEFKNLQTSLVALATVYGVVSAEALKAATIFAQQGRTVQETIILTRAAMLGAQVLGQDVVTVVNNLTAALEGFNIPIGNAVSIIDKFINVEKQFAVTSADLANAVKVTGATANQLGISISSLLGDVTAVVEVTRKSGQEAARGLQFIYARLLTSAKPVLEQIAGINFYLDAQGKSTSELTGKLRNATDILDELASKWKDLTTEQRLNIAIQLGSKRQLVVVNALLQNYDRAIDARIAALTSAGQAEKAFNIVQDTTRFKLNQVSASWNALTSAIGDTSQFKAALDFLNEIISATILLVNIEAGLAQEAAKRKSEIQSEIDIRKSQIQNLEELLTVRKQLLQAPQTDKNIERLNTVTQAIEDLAASNPQLLITIKEGTEAEIQKKIDDIKNTVAQREIILSVKTEIVDVENQIKALQSTLLETLATPKLGIGLAGNLEAAKQQVQKIKELQTKLNKLKEDETKEIEQQYALSKANLIKDNLDALDETTELSGELTAKEKEQLKIEGDLLRFRLDENRTTEELLQKEIDLIKNSQTVYEIHDKTLKLAQLENKVLDEKLKKREEDRKKLANIALQYEQADSAERSRLRRLTELLKLTPEDLVREFETSAYNKNLILDYFSTFRNEAQNAVTDYLARLYDLPTDLRTTFDIESDALDKLEELSKQGGVGVGNIFPAYPGLQPIIKNDTLVDIGNITGLIDQETLNRILSTIESRIKESPAYVDVPSLANEILKEYSTNSNYRKKITDIAGNTNP